MGTDTSDRTMLVTGASGFIAMHCILQLLEQGFRVRGTLRSPSREAIDGCDAVLHVASPFPRTPPKHEDDLIAPAREGVLRVLRLAAELGVRRGVVTSSLAAVL